MKVLRYLCTMALACSLAQVAKADDFAMVVVDPPPTFTFYDITALGSPVTASWTTCATGELPTGTTGYIGCIAFLNGTGTTLKDLELTVPDTGGIVGQTASCPSDPNSVFSTLVCPPNPVGGMWVLDFSGGSIDAGGFFVIGENGADPSSFPDITAVSGVAATPEPGSIWLLSTGFLMGGVLIVNRRRRAACPVTPY